MSFHCTWHCLCIRFKTFCIILDYDECNPRDNVHTVDCGNNEKCVNTDLSYDCVCKTGYTNESSGCVGKYMYFNQFF